MTRELIRLRWWWGRRWRHPESHRAKLGDDGVSLPGVAKRPPKQRALDATWCDHLPHQAQARATRCSRATIASRRPAAQTLDRFDLRLRGRKNKYLVVAISIVPVKKFNVGPAWPAFNQRQQDGFFYSLYICNITSETYMIRLGILLLEEEQDDSLRTWKEQLLGPDVVHTTSLLGEKTSSVQLQGSPGNAACSVLSSSVGPSEALPIVVGLAWTLQNGGNAAPMQSPGVDSLSVHKRGRGRPRKDQQSRQANPPPPPTPTASRRGIKVGCGRPMLAPTSHLETHRGPPGSWRPIIIEKLLAACWSVDAASTGIKRPRGRPRMYTPSAPDTGDAASAGIKRGRGRPRKERPDAASSGIKRGRGRPRKEKPEARMCAETGYAFASTGIKRGGGHPELEMEMLAAAAAMLAETGDDAVPKGTKGVVENPRSVDVVSTGMEGALENPNPRTENPSAGDVMSMVMKRGRGRPRKNQQPQAPTTPAALSTGGIKRGRGRPRKDQQPQAPTTPAALSTGGIKRGRGRPRKDQQPQAPTTPAALSTGGIKRGRGRPRKDQQPQAPTTPAALSTGGIKRGRGRPRKEQQSQAPTTPTALSTGGIKIGHGRPRKEQQSEPKPPLTPTVSRRRGIKVGCGRPMIIEKPPAARSSVDAALSGIKRPRGRPRKETASVGMSAETGDATPAPETGDAAASTVMKRGRGRPRKAGIKRGVCGEAGDAATGGTSASKRGRGRPRKEERRDGAVSGMERGRGRPRKEKAEEEAGMDMLAAAAAAMLAESGWR
uniref:Uncharacterized protein n=1 Tax=Aegilops tauschii TaxID=37682 RepID=M8CCD6_AEGTA